MVWVGGKRATCDFKAPEPWDGVHKWEWHSVRLVAKVVQANFVTESVMHLSWRI